MKHNLVIVDDEPLAISVLKHYLETNPDFEISATFTNPKEAQQFLKENKVNLLLLDVNMPVVNGFQILQHLPRETLVILTTAHKEYLQDGFDAGVLDYLQKPIRKERLEKALARAKKQLLNQTSLEGGNMAIHEKTIHIRSSGKEFYINSDDVLFVKGLKDYSTLYLRTGEKIVLAGSIKIMLQQMKFNWLVRIHRSYAVALAKVNSVTSSSKVHVANHILPLGRSYKEDFLKRYRLGQERR